MSDNEKRETHAQLVELLRRGITDTINRYPNDLPDRLEAAHERELAASGNAAKLREALKALIDYWDWGGYGAARELQLKDKARAALAAPPRNCDVGTAEEQARRFHEFCHGVKCAECRAHFTPEHVTESIRFGRVYCVTKWEQMPYEAEEGGAK